MSLWKKARDPVFTHTPPFFNTLFTRGINSRRSSGMISINQGVRTVSKLLDLKGGFIPSAKRNSKPPLDASIAAGALQSCRTANEA